LSLFLLLLFWLPSLKFWFHALLMLSLFCEELQKLSDARPPTPVEGSHHRTRAPGCGTSERR